EVCRAFVGRIRYERGVWRPRTDVGTSERVRYLKLSRYNACAPVRVVLVVGAAEILRDFKTGDALVDVLIVRRIIQTQAIRTRETIRECCPRRPGAVAA